MSALVRTSLLWLVLAGCSNAMLEPKQALVQAAGDRLTLRGRVCTARPNPADFPVKVVLVVDQSGSMCVSDPPGSQGTAGFCESTGLQNVPPGTKPARVRALLSLLNQFRQRPNVKVALVPFETNIVYAQPANPDDGFINPSSISDSDIGNLQNLLGTGTDYQGALSYAYSIISADITRVSQNAPASLPRTRYVVVFLTDGTPYPRCSANDDLSVYATPQNPELIWRDGFGVEDFCNLIDNRDTIFGDDNITSFAPGTDRNQNYQLFSYVDRLMELKDQFNVGDVRFHSVLLFNQDAVTACGPICQDLYGQYTPAEAKGIAGWLLQKFAERGNGVYQEFSNGDIANLSLGALDYTSLATPNVLKSLFARSLSSESIGGQRVVDSDGDGLPDSTDNSFTHLTQPFVLDSDSDCFEDGFEVRNKALGFTAGNSPDGRGCSTAGCCIDNDGDGLSQYAESFLQTGTGLVDSDGDGIPDGLEARYGLNPKKRDATSIDTDGDGLPDADEIKQGTSPIEKDRALGEQDGFRYETTAQVQPDGSVCYDFTASNLKLVTPPPRAGQRQGFNLFKLYFAEAPESGIATDYGVWRTACAWAQFDPPSVREPNGPELLLADQNFRDPFEIIRPQDYLSRCVGRPP